MPKQGGRALSRHRWDCEASGYHQVVDRPMTRGSSDHFCSLMKHRHSPTQPQLLDCRIKKVGSPRLGLDENPVRFRASQGQHQPRDSTSAPQISGSTRPAPPYDLQIPEGVVSMILKRSWSKKSKFSGSAQDLQQGDAPLHERQAGLTTT